MQWFIRVGIVVVLVVLFALPVIRPVEAALVTVTPSNLQGWQIIPDGTVAVNWVTGIASIGSGSVQFGPIAGVPGENKFIMVTPYTGLASDFVSFSYDYYIDAASTVGSDHFYLNFYVDSSANGIGTFATWYDCRHDYVPTSNVFGAWNTGSVTSGSAWTNIANPLGSCPATISALPAGSEIMFAALDGGQSIGTDDGLAGGFDNVVITTAAGSDTHDFEPDAVVPPADVVDGAAVPGPDMVGLPEGSVVGTFLEKTALHYAPDPAAGTPWVMDAGQSLWVTGLDASLQYYQVVLSGHFLWAPVEAMGPTEWWPWLGTPLPTNVVEE